VAKLIR